MPMKRYTGTAKEAGYEGLISSYLEGIVEDVALGRKDRFSLEIPNGILRVSRGRNANSAVYISAVPTQQQLQGFYKRLADEIFNAPGWYAATLTGIDRSVDGITFSQGPIGVEYGRIQLGVHLPPVLRAGERTWNHSVHEYAASEGVDARKQQIAKKIGEKMRQEGHEVDITESPRMFAVTIYPRSVDADEFSSVMTASDRVHVSFVDNPNNPGRSQNVLKIYADSSVVIMDLRSKYENKDDIDCEYHITHPKYLGTFSSLADNMELGANPDSHVRYRKNVPSTGLMQWLTGPLRAYRTLVQQEEQTERAKEQAIAHIASEEGASFSLYKDGSTFLQVDPSAVYEKVREFSEEEKSTV